MVQNILIHIQDLKIEIVHFKNALKGSSINHVDIEGEGG